MRPMQNVNNFLEHRVLFGLVLLLSLAGCGGGGGGDGPAIQARPQSVVFGAAPTLPLGGSATFVATASSGLAVRYVSQTSSVCAVNYETGLARALTAGDCVVTAIQDGDSTYAPARADATVRIYVDPHQTIAYAAAPALAQYDVATVSATASSGLAVTYSSQTPAICSVDANSGRVSGLAVGSCTIAADQAGTSVYPVYYAAHATQTFAIAPPPGASVPGKPAGLTARLGATVSQVIINVGTASSGGTPITAYTASSSPAGISGTGATSTITVNCPVSCVGYAFSVHASNGVGDGAESDQVNVVTPYYVLETFREPATQPNDSIFIGAFDFDSTNRSVSGLRGYLSESMSGGCATIAGCSGSYGGVPMTMVFSSYQLKSDAVTLGGVNGLLVTSFALDTPNTFFNGSGGDGWSPLHGVEVGGVYYGFPSARNPHNGGVGNSYAMIFVNTADPATALQQAQLDKLAYADCAYGGMMGAVCMTGTSVAGYGAVGTMGGYPVSQVTARQCADLNDLDTLYSQGRLSAGKASLCQSLLSSHP